MKQREHILDWGAVPHSSTKRTRGLMSTDTIELSHALRKVYGEDRFREYMVKLVVDNTCSFDGAEIGSIGVVVKWSLPDDCVIGQHYKSKR